MDLFNADQVLLKLFILFPDGHVLGVWLFDFGKDIEYGVANVFKDMGLFFSNRVFDGMLDVFLVG